MLSAKSLAKMLLAWSYFDYVFGIVEREGQVWKRTRRSTATSGKDFAKWFDNTLLQLSNSH